MDAQRQPVVAQDVEHVEDVSGAAHEAEHLGDVHGVTRPRVGEQFGELRPLEGMEAAGCARAGPRSRPRLGRGSAGRSTAGRPRPACRPGSPLRARGAYPLLRTNPSRPPVYLMARTAVRGYEEGNCDSSTAARVGLLPRSALTFRHDPHGNWRLVAACRSPEMSAGRRRRPGPPRWLDQQLVRHFDVTHHSYATR